MKDYGYDYDPEMGYEDFYGDDRGQEGEKGKHSMLDHVITLLRALIGILDIIGDSISGKK